MNEQKMQDAKWFSKQCENYFKTFLKRHMTVLAQSIIKINKKEGLQNAM